MHGLVIPGSVTVLRMDTTISQKEKTNMKTIMKSSIYLPMAAMLAALTLSGPATAGELVPFKGQSSWVITTVGFDPVKGIVYTHETGEGESTHLGHFTVTGDAAVYIFLPPPGIVVGTYTFTAANGDKLFAILAAHAGVDVLHGEGTVTVVGGTGRFQGATGSWQELTAFAVNPATVAVVAFTNLFYNGTISSSGLQ